MKKTIISTLTMVAASALLMAQTTWAETQGVYDDKIVIGTHSDLSGPLAIGGVPSANGLKMRIDRANAAGGVHGRMIELIIEDARYEVPLAVRLTNKLVQRDKIFAMVLAVGTAQNLATMKILDKNNVPNLFPMTAAGSMTKPASPLHFGMFVDYEGQAAAALNYFHKEKGIKNICLQSVSSDYGQEVRNGVEATAEKLGIEIKLSGVHKGTDTEFAGAATAIKNSGCELLILGTTVKDTITLYATLRQLGFDKPVVGNMLPYMPLVAAAGNGITEGMYLVTPFIDGDFSGADEWRVEFAAEYESTYGIAPSGFVQSGYVAGDLFVKALEAAGRDLTVESLITAVESIEGYKDPFGSPTLTFSQTKHAGGDAVVLVQAKDKKWVILEENLPF